MRFEKVNDDKIKITLTTDDLLANNVDLHDIMSDSLDSQNLFFGILKEAEKEVNFVTKNYLVRIETFAITGNKFILTVTRFLPSKDIIPDKFKTIPQKKVYARRKVVNIDSNNFIYSFSSFDEFCSFCEYYKKTFKNTNFADKIVLYEFNNTYYLVVSDIDFSFKKLKNLFICISEFANYVNHKLFERKLLEYANLIMDNNAIEITVKNFI